MKEADNIKARGSEYFRLGKWNEALQDYQKALSLVPRRPSETPSRNNKGKGRETDTTEENKEVSKTSLSELEQECAKARAVLNGNIGACYVKLVRTIIFVSSSLVLLKLTIGRSQEGRRGLQRRL